MRQFLTFAILFVLVSSTRADDWPQFRGPTGEGLARVERLVTEWGPTKNVEWKAAVPGSGWSSPVIAGGKVFLTTGEPVADSKDISLRAICLDAKNGKILWNVEVYQTKPESSPTLHEKNGYASPTPLVAGDRVFVHFGHLGTACLDLTGKVLWKTRDLAFMAVHGNGGSPILVDDLLIFSRDGAIVRELVALDAATGKTKWKTSRSGYPTKRFSFSTPLLIEVNGAKQVISPGSDVVAAYEPKTGKEVWRVSYDGFSVIPKPVYGHGLVFLSTGYMKPTVMAIRPDGKGDVTKTHVAWKHDRNGPNTPSPLLVGGELYTVSDGGIATCFDAKTGSVHWTKRLPGRGYSASPVAAGGNVYFLAEDGVGTVVEAATAFKQVARNDIEERTLASYAVADGSLFLRTAGHLYRLGK